MQQGDYRKLIVWQRSMELARSVYRLTSKFPREEIYGLTSQMRRAAVSIPSNIAEGRRRGTVKESRRFYGIAFGSTAELETQLDLSCDFRYDIDSSEMKKARSLVDEVARMLNKLTQS